MREGIGQEQQMRGAQILKNIEVYLKGETMRLAGED